MEPISKSAKSLVLFPDTYSLLINRVNYEKGDRQNSTEYRQKQYRGPEIIVPRTGVFFGSGFRSGQIGQIRNCNTEIFSSATDLCCGSGSF